MSRDVKAAGGTDGEFTPARRAGMNSNISGSESSTTAAAAAIATRSASAAATAATTVIGTRARFIHIEGPSLKFFAVQSVDSCLSFLFNWHLHESESAILTGELVLDDVYRRNLTKCRESFTQFILAQVSRNVSYINVHLYSSMVVDE